MSVLVQVAFYKGREDLLDRTIQWWTKGPYSHCEVVVNGVAYSSSTRDNGVRIKHGIDFTSGHWDLVTVNANIANALSWFEAHDGDPYDYLGILGFILPWYVSQKNAYTCVEACANMLGIESASGMCPTDLFMTLIRGQQFKAQFNYA